MEKKKVFRQTKVKRIQCHQTSFITNVKGTCIVKKYKRRKRSTKSTPIKKMAMGISLSIITLNVNGLKYSNQKTQTG